MNSLKNLLTCFLVVLASSSLFAQGITFQKGTLDEIKAKAAKADKPIFVDAFTTWCGPCKWMAANLFPDAEVGAYFNENFIPYKLDMEKGEGLEFAKTYGVRAYPSLVFISAEGVMLHKAVGTPQTPQGLIEVGQAAIDPDQQLFSLSERHKADPSNADLNRKYALALNRAFDDKAQEVATAYLESVNPTEWSTPQNFEFIQEIVTDFSSDVFRHVVDNKATYAKENDAEQVDQYIGAVLDQAVYSVMSRDMEKSKKKKAELEMSYKEILGAEKSKKYIAKLDYMFARQFFREDPEAVHEKAVAYMDTYVDSWQELNQIAWGYYMSMDDKVMLRKALQWATKSVEIDRNPMNMDTQAALYYKLEIYGEAKEVAEATIALAKERGEDASGTEELLEKIDAAIEGSSGKTR